MVSEKANRPYIAVKGPTDQAVSAEREKLSKYYRWTSDSSPVVDVSRGSEFLELLNGYVANHE